MNGGTADGVDRAVLPRHPQAPVELSVVIKALNEETHIARAVSSALDALSAMRDAGFGAGEVVLADSRSSDRTIAIASGYGIRIARLGDAEPRSCGAGPQLGFQHARGRSICLIDGDMALDPTFLIAALGFLRDHPRVAGVGGLVRDVNVVNLEFRRRAVRGAADLRPGPVDRLNGGGLYRREAIAETGYFSDRNLHGYEEYDLAARLRARGWSLHRLPLPFVDHYGYVIGGYALLLHRIRSRYLDGIGELLRASVGKPHLRIVLRDLPEIRLWLCVYLGWLAAGSLAVALPGALKLAGLAVLAALPLGALSLRYRSLSLGLYAFVAWNAHAFGMARGFLRKRRPPDAWIVSTLVEPSSSGASGSGEVRSEAARNRQSTVNAKALASCVLVAGATCTTSSSPGALLDEVDTGSSSRSATQQRLRTASDRLAIGCGPDAAAALGNASARETSYIVPSEVRDVHAR